jgi:hypothetical protein
VPRFLKLSPSAEREERALPPRFSTILAFVGIFLLWWILTAFVYHQTQSNFLRAESGWYLFLSQSTLAIQHDFEKDALTKSYHGHYTPLAFLAEFTTAKLIGTHAAFWKWRQITVLALLATILFLCVRSGGHALQLSGPKANLSATGLTAILIFQPQMRDFVAWPFMIMQLFWLLFTVMALLSLVQMARRPGEILWPWLAAGAAYASLHCLGLGIATVAATAVSLGGMWLGSRHRATPALPRISVPLLIMIAVASLHAIFTLKFTRPAEAIAPGAGPDPASFVVGAFSFIPNYLFATLRNLFSTGELPPSAWQSTLDWPYGLAVILAFGFLVTSAFFRALREPSARNRARFFLQTFASVSFLTMIALISIRQWREPSPQGFSGYLMAPRSLIPGAFALAGIMADLLFLFASAPIFLNAVMNVGLVVCAVTGNLQHAVNVYPKLKPRSTISHASAWQAVVAMARECQSADLAIPNAPLGALTQEFNDWDLKKFEPLLRADLKTPPGTSLQFVAWNEVPNEFYRDVPALVRVQKKLQLETRK